MKEIVKIVITGGPCAGKSTGMSWIQNAFSKLGYKVLFVNETASELITGGVTPWGCASNIDFQKSQIKLQLAKEEIYLDAANNMKEEKILLVCDRGILDNKAYMNDEDFYSILKEFGCSEVELRDNYDAVFHLVSAAKGASEFYTLENNTARTETVEKASELDDKIISAWTGHPHFRVIDNSTNFDDKMKRLIKEICSFIGEPEPYEIERKFLIEYPDISLLESNPHCQKIDIIQTYLNSNNGDEVRIRQRGANGSYIYFKTIKRKLSELKRVEIEKRLSKEEYLEALMDADINKSQIRKTRYCLTYKNQYFEIDIYPFWNDKAIVELELSDSNAEIEFPKYINVIKEVTDDESYKNYSLASKNN